VTCYRCNEKKGHYSSSCANPPAAGGHGGRNQRGRGRGRGGRVGAYYLWVPDEGESGNSQHTEAVAAPISITPAPPPPGYVHPPKSSYFSGVLQGHLILLCHRRLNRWIYDTGRTAHRAYLRETFHSLVAHDEPMYAANGARMTIGGLGTAGPFSDVLFLPDLRVNLFSQKQAMRDGSRITLSPDAQIFTVVLLPNRTLQFIFDGTF
jgi:hypothetical protein